MDIRFDLTTNTAEIPVSPPLTFHWRSRVPVRIQFHRAGVTELLPSGFGIKLVAVLEGDIVAALDTADITAAATTADWYVGDMILHTDELTAAFATATVLRLAVALEVQWWRSGQAATPFISDNVISAGITRPQVLPESTSPIVLDGAEAWLTLRAPRYYPAITELTGGTSVDLDSIATADLPVRTLIHLVIDDVLQTWLLKAATTAEDAANGIVRPDDYAASTNEKVWIQIA